MSYFNMKSLNNRNNGIISFTNFKTFQSLRYIRCSYLIYPLLPSLPPSHWKWLEVGSKNNKFLPNYCKIHSLSKK